MMLGDFPPSSKETCGSRFGCVIGQKSKKMPKREVEAGEPRKPFTSAKPYMIVLRDRLQRYDSRTVRESHFPISWSQERTSSSQPFYLWKMKTVQRLKDFWVIPFWDYSLDSFEWFLFQRWLSPWKRFYQYQDEKQCKLLSKDPIR